MTIAQFTEVIEPSEITGALNRLVNNANSEIANSTGAGTLPVSKGGTGAVTAGAALTALGAAASGANSDITSLASLNTPLSVAQGGTNAVTAGAALTALGAAASGSNSDITQLNGLASTLTTTSGNVRSNINVTTVSPSASNSTALYQGFDVQVVYPSNANSLTGLGHMIGILSEVTNNNTAQTLPLALGTENTYTTLAGTTTTLYIGSENKVIANAGTITSSYNVRGNTISSGTIVISAGFITGLTNTGTITSYIGYWVNNQTSGTISSSFTGFRFENQTTAIAGAKHCLLCLDAGADINTIGPIVTTGKTTTNTFALDTGTKTTTASAGAAVLNKSAGKITTEALTTAGLASYTLTLTNSQIAAADQVFASVAFGSATVGEPTIARVTPSANQVIIIVRNAAPITAFDGTLVVSFMCCKN